MASKHSKPLCIGGWVLLLIGLIAMFLVWFFRPPDRVVKKTVTEKVVVTKNVTVTETVNITRVHNITRTMDVVIMMDASGSINSQQWRQEVEFSRRVALMMSDAFKEKNSSVRVALGQFSTSAVIDVNLTQDVDTAFGKLITWECSKPWDDQCQGDADQRACDVDPNCVERRKGFTETGAAFCGPRPAHGTRTTCREGAVGELLSAPLPPTNAGDDEANCSDTLLVQPLKTVLLVTDGRPMTPNPGPGEPPDVPVRGTIGTKDAVAAAMLAKTASTSINIFGVMVGTDPSVGADDTLKSLSTCCAAEDMHVAQVPNSAFCSTDVPSTCPYYLFVSDFGVLLEKVKEVVLSMAHYETAPCQIIHERSVQRNETVLENETVEHDHYETWSPATPFWLLLLLVPAAVNFCWGWVLLSYAKCTTPASTDAPRDETELSSTDSSTDGILHVPGLANPTESPESHRLAKLTPTSGSAQPVAFPESLADPASASNASGEPFGFAGPIPEAEAALEHPPSAAPGPSEPSPNSVIPVGGPGPSEPEPVAPGGTPGRRWRPGVKAGPPVKKWAPVRHSYIVNGRPVYVEYGASAVAPPAHAPIGARRGSEEASRADRPETAMYQMRLKDAVIALSMGRYLSDRGRLQSAGSAESAEPERVSFESQPGQAAARFRASVRAIQAAQRIKDTAPFPERVISAVLVDPDDLPPRMRAWHCTMCFTCLLTVALIPAVLYLSFGTSTSPWSPWPSDPGNASAPEFLQSPLGLAVTV